jgi:hypothetical protein
MNVAGDGGRRDRQPGIEARFARQGGRGGRMIWAMAVSLTLVALAFLGLWAVQLGPSVHHKGRVTVAQAELFKGGLSPRKVEPPPHTPESDAQ